MNKLIINDQGFYGDDVFENFYLNVDLKNIYDENISELDLNNLPSKSNTQFYLKYPSFEILFNNINKLKNLNIVILVGSYQEKEIAFLKTYYYTELIKTRRYFLAEFLNIDNFDENELIKPSKTDLRYRLIFLVEYLFTNESISLNRSYLKDLFKGKFNKNTWFDSYSKNDLINLDKHKYPRTTSLIDTETISIVFSSLFYEIINEPWAIELLRKRFESSEKVNISDLTPEESVEFVGLCIAGELWQPDGNTLMKT